METITKKKISELKAEFLKKMLPFAEKLRKEGKNDHEISGIIRQYLLVEQKKWYKKENIKRLNAIKVLHNLDSTAEAIIFKTLQKHEIDFKCQIEIGQYQIDFLIDDYLILEIDGLYHKEKKRIIRNEIRDNFFKKLGYETLRIPVSYFSIDKKAIIESIKEAAEVKGVGK